MGSAISSSCVEESADSNETNDTSTGESKKFVEKENDGIIPRVIKNLYRMIDDKEQLDVNSTYKVFVQFLEIYGEDIRDLLDETKTSKVRKVSISVLQTTRCFSKYIFVLVSR
jgi:hypothetical protein